MLLPVLRACFLATAAAYCPRTSCSSTFCHELSGSKIALDWAVAVSIFHQFLYSARLLLSCFRYRPQGKDALCIRGLEDLDGLAVNGAPPGRYL